MILIHGFPFKKEHPQTPSPRCFCPPSLVLEPFPSCIPQGCSLWYLGLRTKLEVKSSVGHMDAEALNERGKRFGSGWRWIMEGETPGAVSHRISVIGVFSPSSWCFSFLPALSGRSTPHALSVLGDFLPGSFLLLWPRLTPSWLGAALGSKPPGNSSHLPGARAKILSEHPVTSAR